MWVINSFARTEIREALAARSLGNPPATLMLFYNNVARLRQFRGAARVKNAPKAPPQGWLSATAGAVNLKVEIADLLA